MRVYLIGFMTAGKTTMGFQLSRELGMQFSDLDQQIATQEQMPVKQIFEKYGENYFREKEKQVLHATFRQNQLIIATGGGTPCFFDNLTQMKKNGLIFYLKIPKELIINRIQKSFNKRPLAANQDTETLTTKVNTLYEKRKYFYQQAHFSVDATNKNALHYITRILSGYMY